MPLDKPVESITEADLAALIDAAVLELKTLDYKQALPGASIDSRKEFLADVVSFANCAGGHLVYGIREKDGVPVELLGLDDEADGAILRLENMIRDGIAPRMAVQSTAVKLANSRTAIVMRIPKSFAFPHMVVYQGGSRFFSRGSNGKYQMDVHQIRSAFLGSETTSERIRNFRLDRISQINARELPLRLEDGPAIVVHIIPTNAFGNVARYDLVPLKANASIYQSLAPLFRNFANNSRINFDGLLVYDSRGQEQSVNGFSQLYRSGIIETVDTHLISASEQAGRGKIFPGLYFEVKLLRSLRSHVSVLKSLNIDLPLVVALSLVNVRGYTLGREVHIGWLDGGDAFDREMLLPQEILLDSYDADLPSVMKPAFDELWNAAGFGGSVFYKDGKFIGEDVAHARGGI